MFSGRGRLIVLVATISALVFPPLHWACSGSGGSQSDATVGFGDGKGGSDSVSPSKDTPPPTGCQVSQDCPAEMPLCDQFSNTCVECKMSSDCHDSEKPMCNPALKKCVECVMNSDCKNEFLYCLEGECSDKACFPGHAMCVGNAVHICSADGMDPNAVVIECAGNICHSGQCLECKPSTKGCKGEYVIQCNEDGSDFTVVETCVAPNSCFGDSCMFCYPGDKKCDGNIAMVCTQDGAAQMWTEAQNCTAAGLSCQQGACLSPCAGDFKQNTNAGCEFFAVDLDNYQSPDNDAFNAQFAVIVSNTSDKKEETADVTVTKPDGSVLTASVPGGALYKFELPPSWGVNDTMQGMSAFKISASRPITVYQFNPLSNVVEVFSNDASVLLPTPGLGTEYYVMTYGFGGTKVFNEPTPSSFFTVVGSSTIPTQVTFTVSANTLAGGDIPALTKGQSHTVELTQGEVLNVNSKDPGGDLTGTHIEASAPVVVFGGHECPFTSDRCCCDHLEQQLIPVSAWGTHYLISKSWERWKEQDYIRILASENDTHVTLNPAVTMVETLSAGGHFTFQTSSNLEITSDKPILVAQFLPSSHEILGDPYLDPCFNDSDCPQTYVCDWFSGMCAGKSCTNQSNCPSGHTCEIYPGRGGYCEAIGDPAMILAVSEEQFMESYVFLTPDAYLEDYLNIIAPSTAQAVVLDGQQLDPSQFAQIGASGYAVYRTPVADGVHSIWSDKKIGIVVYGYDNDVSYGYPGGMGLVDL